MTANVSHKLAIVSAETYRSHRKESLRRSDVTSSLSLLESLTEALQNSLRSALASQELLETQVHDLENVVEEIVGIGLRGGWYPKGGYLTGIDRKRGRRDASLRRESKDDDSGMLDGSVLTELLASTRD